MRIRGSNRAAARGPSTSPLEVHTKSDTEEPESAAQGLGVGAPSAAFDAVSSIEVAECACGKKRRCSIPTVLPVRHWLRSRQYFFDGLRGARQRRRARAAGDGLPRRKGLWWLRFSSGALNVMAACGFS